MNELSALAESERYVACADAGTKVYEAPVPRPLSKLSSAAWAAPPGIAVRYAAASQHDLSPLRCLLSLVCRHPVHNFFWWAIAAERAEGDANIGKAGAEFADAFFAELAVEQAGDRTLDFLPVLVCGRDNEVVPDSALGKRERENRLSAYFVLRCKTMPERRKIFFGFLRCR